MKTARPPDDVLTVSSLLTPAKDEIVDHGVKAT